MSDQENPDVVVSETIPTEPLEVETIVEEAEPVEIPEATETVEEGETTEPVEPEYTPDYSYKVYDDVKEFPELFRPVVKDKETEDMIRSYMCKADGLDGMKLKHERVVKERDEMKPQYEELTQGLRDLRHHAENDLDKFLELYGISEDKLINHVSQKLKMQELPQEDRQVYEDGLQAKRQSYDYQRQLEGLKTQNEESLRTQHDMMLNQTLSQPETADFARKYNEIYGEGAFRNDVIQHGATTYATQKKDLAPQEAVNYVLNRHKPVIDRLYTQTQGTTPVAAPVAEGAPAPAPTIPNVGTGRSVSPTKPTFKSIEDLRKFAKDKYGS